MAIQGILYEMDNQPLWQQKIFQAVTYVSCSVGIFLCAQCARFHEQLKPGLNKILSVTSPEFTEPDVKLLHDIGNRISNNTYERRVPLCYRRPTYNDPIIMMEQWIRAKYERKEFMEGMPQPDYMARTKEGYLWKRGKDNKQFKIRKFVLCKQTKKLKYYTKEGPNNTPKAELCLDTIDAFIVPEKIGNPNGMQIMYESKGLTRSLYVYTETSEELISWYVTIYAAKLQWQQIAFPCTSPEEDAFPKGEVFIGSKDSGQYNVTSDESAYHFYSDDGASSNVDGGLFVFFVKTPQRTFTFQAESEQIRKEWLDALLSIIEKPLTPYEQSSF